jgi:hypothetical protein
MLFRACVQKLAGKEILASESPRVILPHADEGFVLNSDPIEASPLRNRVDIIQSRMLLSETQSRTGSTSLYDPTVLESQFANFGLLKSYDKIFFAHKCAQRT